MSHDERMDTTEISSALTCEQVFNVWSTEPHLIRLFDLRPKEEFDAGHIPGAINIHPGDILVEMENIGQRLAVLIAPAGLEVTLQILLGGHSNYVFMTQCQRWKELALPIRKLVDGVPSITVEGLAKRSADVDAGRVRIVDVRRPDEYDGEYGHIERAELVTLGPDLTKWLENADPEQEIVFVCRSGARSGVATTESLAHGFHKTSNLIGGMIEWNRRGLPVTRGG